MRENAPRLGNLIKAFNFGQPPRKPFLLPTNPATDSSSVPPFFTGEPACVGCTALPPVYVSPGAGHHRHRRGGLGGG